MFLFDIYELFLFLSNFFSFKETKTTKVSPIQRLKKRFPVTTFREKKLKRENVE